jgi:K+-sensing histidine kinase KdpD
VLERRIFFVGKRKKTLPEHTCVLVCVTGQKGCDRLIRTGRRIADRLHTPLQVLCVQPTSAGYDASGEELEYLRQTSRDADAEMTVFFHDEAALVALGFMKRSGAVHVVTGMAEAPVNGFVDMIHRLAPSVPISMVSKEGIVYNICPESQKGRGESYGALVRQVP